MCPVTMCLTRWPSKGRVASDNVVRSGAAWRSTVEAGPKPVAASPWHDAHSLR